MNVMIPSANGLCFMRASKIVQNIAQQRNRCIELRENDAFLFCNAAPYISISLLYPFWIFYCLDVVF